VSKRYRYKNAIPATFFIAILVATSHTTVNGVIMLTTIGHYRHALLVMLFRLAGKRYSPGRKVKPALQEPLGPMTHTHMATLNVVKSERVGGDRRASSSAFRQIHVIVD